MTTYYLTNDHSRKNATGTIDDPVYFSWERFGPEEKDIRPGDELISMLTGSRQVLKTDAGWPQWCLVGYVDLDLLLLAILAKQALDTE